MSHWLEDAIREGLSMMDVDEALEAQAEHFSLKGEWQKGVISPSLVALECPLSRVKIFLGHTPVPFQTPHMATRAGRKDPISLLNMVRGFDTEGLMVAALEKIYPEHIVDHAPKFQVEWFDEETGHRYAGHPDVLMRLPSFHEEAPLGLIQIKSVTVFKMERTLNKGDADALKGYLPQMATELYIARKAGYEVSENTVLMVSWEGTPKQSRARVKAITLEWEDSLATIPEMAAEQIHADAANALMFNQWPEAFPQTSWDVWPCSYCRFARLGDFEVPACDDHAKWRNHVSDDADLAGGRP